MRRKSLVLLAVVLTIAAMVAGSAFADGTLPWWHDFTENPVSPTQDEYYMVVFNDPPAATYAGDVPGLARTKPERGQKLNPNSRAVRAYVDHLANEHANYRAYLNDKAPRAEVVRNFTLVGNAVAVKRNGTRPQVLQQGPGVRYVTPSALYRPAMNVSTSLIGADSLWGQLGGQASAGAGINVGVIDSGIDDTHRFFDCKGDIQHKVYASGVAFDPTNVLVSDHGTHVAGTIGGCLIELTDGPITGPISGVAPGAALYDYNVFPGFGGGYVAFGGSAFSHDIAAALEDTVADGMHVVNMSLGGTVQGPHDFLAEAVNATVEAGLLVAVAAGNSGPGDATVESPGNAANALTAGASTNPHFIGISVTVDGLGNFGAALGDFNNFDPAISAAYTTTTPANGCSTISTDLTGKIALIDRGACSFTTKIRNAQNAGAVGVLVANNVAGDPVAMGHDGTDLPTIPAAMVSKDNGAAMGQSGTVTVDGTTITEFVTDNADIIAGFSSRGPTPYTYLIKPDVTAPGVNVYSSVFDNEFAMFQGTSMATPHLAGAAALLMDLYPDWSQFDVKSAIVNTAKRPVYDHITGMNDAGVLARGNGRVALEAAGSAVVTFDPVSVSFGYWSGNKPVVADATLALNNVSGSAVSCDVAVNGPHVTLSTDQVDIGVGESETLVVSLDAGRSGESPSGDYGGDIEFSCNGTESVVPWWVRIHRQAKP